MRKYDSIVVGGGISGLTMGLFLSLSGQKVLLLEKGPHLGGSVARFYRKKVPFDIGFHFTGGLQEGGIMHNILTALGLADSIEPIFLYRDGASSFVFEDEGRAYTIPYGVERVKDAIKGYFPSEADAVERYFRLLGHVCENTPSMDLNTISFIHPRLKEDFVTLDEVLKELTPSPLLRGLLSGYAMCYGVKPSEVSFANHARMCMNFYESLAYAKGGGDAFVSAFRSRFEELGVEVRCGRHIAGLADIKDSRVGRFVLSDGEEVAAENCVFTIHPFEILKLLPLEHFKKAFVNRVRSFEPSVGFFSVFATLSEEAGGPLGGPTILSLFPSCDINSLLDPGYTGRPGLVVIKSVEERLEKGIRPLHLLEPAFPSATAPWNGTVTGKRPQEYIAYKERRVESIREHVFDALPEYRGRLEVLESSSMLTFRDYLNSPDGSAYGIKQKIGQYNLVGRLALRNLFAAGQSAVLPGVIGAMMSAFIVGRTMIDREQYERVLSRHYAVK